MFKRLQGAGTRWDIGYSYNIQRKYPFKDFTASVTIALILLFTFFSVYNVATNGFDLQPIYTTDPNSTQSQTHWFLNPIFTFGDRKLAPKCQSRDLSVASQFTTTNQGTLYTLNSIQSIASAGDDDNDGQMVNLITFLNNTLDNCQVNKVTIKMTQDADGQGTDWWVWENTITAFARCDLTNNAGKFRISFTTSSDNLYIADQNRATRASVWWGRRLFGAYDIGLRVILGHDPRLMRGDNLFVKSAGITFDLNKSVASKDVLSMDLFSLRYSMTYNNGAILHQGIDGIKNNAQRYNNNSFSISRPLTEAFSLARVYYSLIQLDLNQVQRSNLFLTEDDLRAALDSKNNFNHQTGGYLANGTSFDWFRYNAIAMPGQQLNDSSPRLNQAYDQIRLQTGPLGTRAAFIPMQYICSVPSRKSIGTIVWTTLIANFVLLAAANQIIMFFAHHAVSNRDPKAMYCEGCISQSHAMSNLTPLLRDAGPMATSSDDIKHGSSSLSAHRSDSSYTLLPDPRHPDS